MTRPGLVRLVILGAAAACVLVGLHLLPAVPLPGDLGPRPAVIVNDLAAPVVVVPCRETCPAAGGSTVAPGRDLRVGPPGVRWRIEDAGAVTLGCLTATAAGQRLLVSRSTSCRS